MAPTYNGPCSQRSLREKSLWIVFSLTPFRLNKWPVRGLTKDSQVKISVYVIWRGDSSLGHMVSETFIRLP